MASFLSDNANFLIASQALDWANDDIRVMLLQGAGTPARDNVSITDVLAETDVDECDATNYVRKTLAGNAITQSTSKALLDGTNPVWSSLGGATNNTITGAAFYKHVTNDADAIFIGYIDTADLPTNGGDVTLAKDATKKFFVLDANPA